MMKSHVILVPGLADRKGIMDYLTRSWKKDVVVHIHPAPWEDMKPFGHKLEMLLKLIDHCAKHSGKVSLIGVSAGGSLVMNAFCHKKAKIHRVINICGRLREGKNVSPTLDTAIKGHPSFKNSVLLCEKGLSKLTSLDKAKIMTIRALFDGTVPTSTTPIVGAINITIPFAFHIFAIGAAFLFYKKSMLQFIKE